MRAVPARMVGPWAFNKEEAPVNFAGQNLADFLHKPLAVEAMREKLKADLPNR